MQIETSNRMQALQIKVRAEIGAKTIMQGQFPTDLSQTEQVIAQRLAEIWKQGEEAAEVTVEWRIDHEGTDAQKVVYTLAIKRKDGTIEKYDGQSTGDQSTGNQERGEKMQNDQKPDYVNHPPHYATHPSGVECVDIAEHLSFNLGNALKYLWRAKMKDDHIENLEKCLWYLEREVRMLRLTDQTGCSFDDVVRLNAQKFLDKEGKTSAIGKFVDCLTASVLNTEDFGELQKIVRAEIKLVKAGDSR
jgi:archaellin